MSQVYGGQYERHVSPDDVTAAATSLSKEATTVDEASLDEQHGLQRQF